MKPEAYDRNVNIRVLCIPESYLRLIYRFPMYCLNIRISKATLR